MAGFCRCEPGVLGGERGAFSSLGLLHTLQATSWGHQWCTPALAAPPNMTDMTASALGSTAGKSTLAAHPTRMPGPSLSTLPPNLLPGPQGTQPRRHPAKHAAAVPHPTPRSACLHTSVCRTVRRCRILWDGLLAVHAAGRGRGGAAGGAGLPAARGRRQDLCVRAAAQLHIVVGAPGGGGAGGRRSPQCLTFRNVAPTVHDVCSASPAWQQIQKPPSGTRGASRSWQIQHKHRVPEGGSESAAKHPCVRLLGEGHRACQGLGLQPGPRRAAPPPVRWPGSTTRAWTGRCTCCSGSASWRRACARQTAPKQTTFSSPSARAPPCTRTRRAGRCRTYSARGRSGRWTTGTGTSSYIRVRGGAPRTACLHQAPVVRTPAHAHAGARARTRTSVHKHAHASPPVQVCERWLCLCAPTPPRPTAPHPDPWACA